MSDYSKEAYDLQLQQKKDKTLEEFAPFFSGDLEVFPSPNEHYRMRAEFRVWHDGEDLYYVMFDQETREKYRVDSFPIASKKINELMPVLIEKVKSSTTLRSRLFQVDFLSSLSGELVISLLYHKQLNEEWKAAVLKLKLELKGEGFHVDFVGRAKKQKFVVQREFVVEKLQVHDRTYTYKQIENSFTQPNGFVAQKMLEWAVDQTRECERDLLELYCGNGNFSIALAQNFRHVLATELAKPSVASAQWNIKTNEIVNLKIARLSAQELTEAMKREREFKRLAEQDIKLSKYDFSTVFVDPPRSGMDLESVQMVQQFDCIMYISCNPITLLENLEVLGETHEVKSMALFDQFPYTEHREVGVFLQKKITEAPEEEELVH